MNINLIKLKEALKIIQPEYLFTIINDRLQNQSLQEYIDAIHENLDDSVLLLSGSQPIQQGISITETTIFFKSMKETMIYLQKI